MVAYSFQAEFIDPIERKVKRQTLRNERARHARPGEELQLYYAMRNKNCRLIGRATCAAVTPILIQFAPAKVEIYGREVIDTVNGLAKFAQADGFENWGALRAFWDKKHDCPPVWQGVIIEWKDFKPAAILKGTKP